jgi:hypothetical protein
MNFIYKFYNEIHAQFWGQTQLLLMCYRSFEFGVLIVSDQILLVGKETHFGAILTSQPGRIWILCRPSLLVHHLESQSNCTSVLAMCRYGMLADLPRVHGPSSPIVTFCSTWPSFSQDSLLGGLYISFISRLLTTFNHG